VLEMRTACERCDAALPLDADARICSYECTFCPACTEGMSGRCPNCGGELLPRPRRARAGPPGPLNRPGDGDAWVRRFPGTGPGTR
jgi:uncharacterized protein